MRRPLLILGLCSLLSACEPVAIALLGAGASTAFRYNMDGVAARTFTAAAADVKSASLGALDPTGAGDSITLGDVLFIGGNDAPQFGAPTVAGASVTATILGQVKGKKINAFTYKPKKNIQKHWGHRQQLTRVRIETIAAG